MTDDRPDPRRMFGTVLDEQIAATAADYRHLADALEYQIRSARAGTTEGIRARATSATDLAAEAAQVVARWTPSLAGVIRAAADYDRNVPASSQKD